MASTPNHAAQGALIAFAFARLMYWILSLLFPVAIFFLTPLPTAILTLLLLFGAVMGAAPDIIGAIGRIGKPWDWDLYIDAHEGAVAKVFKIFPPYLLHIEEDKLFHNPENGGHWWPGLWWLELFFWVVTAILFWALCLI